MTMSAACAPVRSMTHGRLHRRARLSSFPIRFVIVPLSGRLLRLFRLMHTDALSPPRCRPWLFEEGYACRGAKRRAPTKFALPPAVEAIVDRSVRTVDARAIAPATACTKHAEYTADDAAVILTWRPAPAGWEYGLYCFPLFRREPTSRVFIIAGIPIVPAIFTTGFVTA